ncbi:MAG: hypothetical protein AAFW73_03035 [Bacteroidota bacterium]
MALPIDEQDIFHSRIQVEMDEIVPLSALPKFVVERPIEYVYNLARSIGNDLYATDIVVWAILGEWPVDNFVASRP